MYFIFLSTYPGQNLQNSAELQKRSDENRHPVMFLILGGQ